MTQAEKTSTRSNHMMTAEIFEQRRDGYLVSSDPSLLSLSAINAAFGTAAMSWCRPLPEPALRTCLEKSFCLGLYIETPSSTAPDVAIPSRQIGFARMITDYTTIMYLTDIYVDAEYQGRGLGAWLIDCIQEIVDGMGHLRKLMLVAATSKNQEYYTEKLGVQLLSPTGPQSMARNGPGYKGKLTGEVSFELGR